MSSGESSGFEALVLPHLDAAYTLARYLTRNDHDAEDVVQDACLRAFTYRDSYRGDTTASARAWLLTIVRNTAYSWHRRGGAGPSVVEFDETAHSESVAQDHPEAELLRLSAQESVRRALDELSPEFREVIVLRELQGLSYQEISEIVGVPVGTVMSRLSRSRGRLQRALRAAGEGG